MNSILQILQKLLILFAYKTMEYIKTNKNCDLFMWLLRRPRYW